MSEQKFQVVYQAPASFTIDVNAVDKDAVANTNEYRCD